MHSVDFLYADYNIATQWPKHMTPTSKRPTVLRTDRVEVTDPFMSLLSDSKNVYDALSNELPQDDKKAAVETPIIEELVERMRGRSRWIPHNANPSDALTKITGAPMQPLIDLLKSGFYHLKTEEAELKERARAKETRATRQD